MENGATEYPVGKLTPTVTYPPVSSNDELHEKKTSWWTYLWDYYPDRSKTERRFVQKLDVCLLTMLSLGYFIKYVVNDIRFFSPAAVLIIEYRNLVNT